MPQDFRLFLQQEFTSRCRRNPRYSLRCYARDLNISPSSLSAMLNGKRPITNKMKFRLGITLGLTSNDLEPYLKPKRASLSLEKINYKMLSFDEFHLIQDWYHNAILELIKLPQHKLSAASVAQSLKIPHTTALMALERLERLGLIKLTDDGAYLDLSTGHNSSLHPDMTSTALREHQKQLLEKSLEALAEQPIGLRDHTGITMAIDRADLPELKKIIKKFRRELAQYAERPARTPNDVYQLTINLFSLTQLAKDQ